MSTAQVKIFTEPRVHLWTSEEYYKLAEAGLFEGKRVELIGGKVIEMSAQSRPHVRAVKRATRALERAFGEGWFVQSQAPLDLDDLDGDSQPEPDVAVIARKRAAISSVSRVLTRAALCWRLRKEKNKCMK